MRTSARASSPSFAPMSMCRCLSSGAFLRSSPSSRWIGRLPTTPGIGPSRVSTSSRWPTSTTVSQPPTAVNHRKPSSSMWWTISPISSMCPAIASSGPSPDPRTRATVEPTVSWRDRRRTPRTRRGTPPRAPARSRTGLPRSAGGEGRQGRSRVVRHQLAQHELQDPAVPVVLDLLRGVDPHPRRELLVVGLDGDLLGRPVRRGR